MEAGRGGLASQPHSLTSGAASPLPCPTAGPWPVPGSGDLSEIALILLRCPVPHKAVRLMSAICPHAF